MRNSDTTNPCDPSAVISTKCNLPCRLKSLEVLVRLEEGLDRQCIDDSEGEKEAKD